MVKGRKRKGRERRCSFACSSSSLCSVKSLQCRSVLSAKHPPQFSSQGRQQQVWRVAGGSVRREREGNPQKIYTAKLAIIFQCTAKPTTNKLAARHWKQKYSLNSSPRRGRAIGISISSSLILILFLGSSPATAA